MKHLKPFKLFEGSVINPVKKFPTEPAVHYLYLLEILEENGIDRYDIDGNNNSLSDFCFEKCSKENIVFPNMVDSEGFSDPNDLRYQNFIFGESVFLLPEYYDPSSDSDNYNKKKDGFLDRMKDYAKDFYKTKEEQDKFLSDVNTHTNFGPTGYDWVNESLKLIHDKLKQYYKNGKLRVWMPKDHDYDYWKGIDHPHKYNVIGKLVRPNGVYFLSDIENFIDDKYGIKDELLYDFIIRNKYIEGRHWERVWSFDCEENSPNKLKKSNFGEYGMEPTENITHILNIIEKEFGNEIKGDDYEGFPVYIDYYKEVKEYR